ncbi:MAG TPA: hypothetical protein VEB86_13740 [Chryseosolibacter sp.]|nr:hypothetical protein [Chryseosolibacter sp.]
MSNHEFITSVNLNLTEIEKTNVQVFHFVYGGQLYGTLFGLFAKFLKIGPNASGEYLVTGMDLKLLNYQGVLNLGFTKHEDLKYSNGKFDFDVVGESTFDATQTPVMFNTPLVVAKNEPVEIVFSRRLMPLPGFEFDPDDHNPSKPLPPPVPKKSLFDSEFYYRSGEEWYFHELRPGMFGYKEPQTPAFRTMEFPSLRCHQSKVSLSV